MLVDFRGSDESVWMVDRCGGVDRFDARSFQRRPCHLVIDHLKRLSGLSPSSPPSTTTVTNAPTTTSPPVFHYVSTQTNTSTLTDPGQGLDAKRDDTPPGNQRGNRSRRTWAAIVSDDLCVISQTCKPLDSHTTDPCEFVVSLIPLNDHVHATSHGCQFVTEPGYAGHQPLVVRRWELTCRTLVDNRVCLFNSEVVHLFA